MVSRRSFNNLIKRNISSKVQICYTVNKHGLQIVFILRSFCLALLYLQRFVLKVSDVSACTGLTWGRMFADMYYQYRPHVVIGPGKYVSNIIFKFIYSIDLPRIASIAVVVIIIIFLNVIVIVVIIIIIIIIITTNLFLFTTLLC